MNRSLSWIDPHELSAALVAAGARRQPRDLPRPVNAGLLRLTPATVSPAATSPQHEARPRGLPAFRPPEGSLQVRLKAFLAWVIDATGCRRIFIADEEGLVLMEKGADSELIAVSSSFMSLLERIRSCLGSETRGIMAIDLDVGRMLHLILVTTDLGRFTLGLVVPDPLRRSLIDELRQALEQVLASEAVEELFGT